MAAPVASVEAADTSSDGSSASWDSSDADEIDFFP